MITDSKSKTQDSRQKDNLVCGLVSVVCGLIFLVLSTTSVYGQVTSLKDILSFSDRFDGETIEVEGEVIGEPIRADGGLWVNISSGGRNIGIFVSEENLLKKIKHWGGYRQAGDYVRIVGKFNKDCPQHQEKDIHATRIYIIERGHLRQETVSPHKVRLTITFFIICLTLIVIYFIKLGYGKGN